MKIIPNKDRVLILVNLEAKNSYRLTDDITIRLELGIENYNLREINAVQGDIVADVDYLKRGWQVLVDHNSFHDTHKIFSNEFNLPPHHSLYSVPKSEVYCYREAHTNKSDAAIFYSKWLPCPGFFIVDRIWEKYDGQIEGIPPKELKNRLFVLEGNYKHKVLCTGNHCDYTIIFQGDNGRPQPITRMRDNVNGYEEIEAVSEELTERVLSGELLVGETASTAKKFEYGAA